jgi:hypothetical protein
MELPKTRRAQTAPARDALAKKRRAIKIITAANLLRDEGALVVIETPRCASCSHAIGHHGDESGICFVGECTCNKGRAQ